MIISERDRLEEQSGPLRKTIGSTQSGTGSAVRRRIDREPSVRLAKHEERLRQFLEPVAPFMRAHLAAGHRLIIEGTQGFGLSLLHSIDYPYVTSRDTTAAAFVSEAGLSPLDVDEIVLVLRAFPIRVGGNSGPLPKEIQWEMLSREAGSSVSIVEYTSVTRSVRRVARFDPDVARQAILANTPTHIVLNHLDYVDASCRCLKGLSNKAACFVDRVESLIGAPIDYVGCGPSSLVTRVRIRAEAELA